LALIDAEQCPGRFHLSGRYHPSSTFLRSGGIRDGSRISEMAFQRLTRQPGVEPFHLNLSHDVSYINMAFFDARLDIENMEN
jgi:hypothetical protein